MFAMEIMISLSAKMVLFPALMEVAITNAIQNKVNTIPATHKMVLMKCSFLILFIINTMFSFFISLPINIY